jgi:ABC-type dipeptide/oligopeptide/nickel transport system permease subunit
MADVALPLDELGAHPARSPWKLAWDRFRDHKAACISAVFLALLIVVALAAPLISRYPPNYLGFDPVVGPSWAHWMGTDHLGRDLWSRVIYGARISLLVGFGSQALAVTIGVLVGMTAGYFGGWLDSILMRLTDIMQALPGILLAMLFVTVLGSSTRSLILAIGLATWPVMARVIRSQVLQARRLQYVEAAAALGCSSFRTLSVHIFRNVLGPIIVLATFGIPSAMFTEALLSYIGLGPPPPSPSWGRIISDAFPYLEVSPHYMLFPAIALSVTLLAFNFLGDGLRDAFDPQGAD